MTNETTANARLTRRQLLRTGVAGIGTLGVALAIGQVDSAAPAYADIVAQDKWRFCNLCYGLFWGSPGYCEGHPQGPSFGPHVVGTTNYVEFTAAGVGETPGYQHGWRYCSKCHLMHYSDGGRCPAGGAHHAGSENYANYYHSSPYPSKKGLQAGWRYCSQCRGLWYASGRSNGACPGYSNGHIASGYYYALQYG